MKTKMKEKIKIGIIGVGNISEEHIQSYLRSPDAELYAFCDINSDRLTKMGEKYQITRLYHDYHEMLSLPELDAVSVCTWNSAHAPAAVAALDAGKHVLCEKPMAVSYTHLEAFPSTTGSPQPVSPSSVSISTKHHLGRTK